MRIKGIGPPGENIPDPASRSREGPRTTVRSDRRSGAGTGPRRPCRDRRLQLEFPPSRARSSSMRSGPSSPRRRRTATPTIRSKTARGTPGTMWRSTPRAGWFRASRPASGRPRTSWRWSRTSNAARGGRLLDLITTDGYPAYAEAILNAYGETITPPRSGKRGRPWVPYKTAPAGLTYAVVEKTREGPGGRDRHPGGLRRDGRRDGGSWDVAREPSDQHVVPGAAKRHRQAPQRPEGSQDAPILERLAMS